MRIICTLCMKDVDRIFVQPDYIMCRYQVTAECHGQHETMDLDERFIAQCSAEEWAILTGFAFQSNLLADATK